MRSEIFQPFAKSQKGLSAQDPIDETANWSCGLCVDAVPVENATSACQQSENPARFLVNLLNPCMGDLIRFPDGSPKARRQKPHA